jgi:hypothetical protein
MQKTPQKIKNPIAKYAGCEINDSQTKEKTYKTKNSSNE